MILQPVTHPSIATSDLFEDHLCLAVQNGSVHQCHGNCDLLDGELINLRWIAAHLGYGNYTKKASSAIATWPLGLLKVLQQNGKNFSYTLYKPEWPSWTCKFLQSTIYILSNGCKNLTLFFGWLSSLGCHFTIAGACAWAFFGFLKACWNWVLIIPCLLWWLWWNISGLKQTAKSTNKVSNLGIVHQIVSKAVEALTLEVTFSLPDSSCADIVTQIVLILVTARCCESLSWILIGPHCCQMMTSLRMNLRPLPADEACPPAEHYQKKLVATVMEPNHNLLLRTDSASNAVFRFCLTNLLKKECRTSKKE